jgi:HSP20 family molecular chaperone IbpA
MIRADVHYDASANQLKAMLELPGLKKSHIKIVLSKCPYTRVKQIHVSGISTSVFPEVGYSVRERKFGRFARTLVVPPETTVRSSVLVLSFSDSCFAG